MPTYDPPSLVERRIVALLRPYACAASWPSYETSKPSPPAPIFQVGAATPAVVTMPLSWSAPTVALPLASGRMSRL
jgi:hypothetical protein